MAGGSGGVHTKVQHVLRVRSHFLSSLSIIMLAGVARYSNWYGTIATMYINLIVIGELVCRWKVI